MLSGGREPGLGGLQRSVADLPRSIAFYCGALGFHVVEQPAHGTALPRVRLALGGEHIDLVQVDAGSLPAPAGASEPRFQHAAIVAADMEAAWQRLRRFAPAAITEGDAPQRLPASSGGVTAFKFRDPDGHALELLHFPQGVGDDRWRTGAIAMPTLGIDHFALGVSRLERSIAFYAALGFRITARQINRGVEQDRLDGVSDAVVDVVTLQSNGLPPHLELLAYRSVRAAPDGSAPGPYGAPGCDLIRLGSGEGPDQGSIVDPDGHAFVVSGTRRSEHLAADA